MEALERNVQLYFKETLETMSRARQRKHICIQIKFQIRMKLQILRANPDSEKAMKKYANARMAYINVLISYYYLLNDARRGIMQYLLQFTQEERKNNTSCCIMKQYMKIIKKERKWCRQQAELFNKPVEQLILKIFM